MASSTRQRSTVHVHEGFWTLALKMTSLLFPENVFPKSFSRNRFPEIVFPKLFSCFRVSLEVRVRVKLRVIVRVRVKFRVRVRVRVSVRVRVRVRVKVRVRVRVRVRVTVEVRVELVEMRLNPYSVKRPSSNCTRSREKLSKNTSIKNTQI